MRMTPTRGRSLGSNERRPVSVTQSGLACGGGDALSSVSSRGVHRHALRRSLHACGNSCSNREPLLVRRTRRQRRRVFGLLGTSRRQISQVTATPTVPECGSMWIICRLALTLHLLRSDYLHPACIHHVVGIYCDPIAIPTRARAHRRVCINRHRRTVMQSALVRRLAAEDFPNVHVSPRDEPFSVRLRR